MLKSFLRIGLWRFVRTGRHENCWVQRRTRFRCYTNRKIRISLATVLGSREFVVTSCQLFPLTKYRRLQSILRLTQQFFVADFLTIIQQINLHK